MSDYALKILSACPKSLLDDWMVTEFDSDLGVILVQSKSGLKNAKESWGGSKFSKVDEEKYANHLEKLYDNEAIVDFKPTYNISLATSDLDAINRDLNNQDSLIEFAINSDNITNLVPQHIIDRFNQLGNVKKNKKKLIIPGKKKVKMKSAELAKSMTPYAFDCTTFKIMDPYIFEFSEQKYFKGGKDFVEKTKDKMSFLFELFKQIEKHNTYEESDISIEVFGRSYKTFTNKPPRDLNEKDVIDGLSRLRELSKFIKKYDIKFIGMDDRNDFKVKFHERFFYTERFIFEIENSFEEKRGTQIIKFALQQDRDELFRRFNIKSNYYHIDFTIDKRDFR